MTILRRFLLEAARRTRPFFDALRQDRFFLFCSLVGSYLVLQIVGNYLSGRFASVPIFFLGIVLILAGTLERLTDHLEQNREASSD